MFVGSSAAKRKRMTVTATRAPVGEPTRTGHTPVNHEDNSWNPAHRGWNSHAARRSVDIPRPTQRDTPSPVRGNDRDSCPPPRRVGNNNGRTGPTEPHRIHEGRNAVEPVTKPLRDAAKKTPHPHLKDSLNELADSAEDMAEALATFHNLTEEETLTTVRNHAVISVGLALADGILNLP